MKKKYEKPSLEKVSFQQINDIAEIEASSNPIDQGGGEWDALNGNFQLHS